MRDCSMVCITGFHSRQSEFDQADGHGLYHRFSANCRAIFVPASLKFGSKVELKKCFSEIILTTVSDVWAVC